MLAMSFLIVIIGYIAYRIVTRGERGDRKSALTTLAGADYG
jgi:hypothetical protein